MPSAATYAALGGGFLQRTCMLDREIPDATAAVLRTMCGLGEFAELPPKLESKYWEFRRICERDNGSVQHNDLRWLVFHLGYGKPLQRESNPTIVDLWLKGRVKREDRVLVKWRN